MRTAAGAAPRRRGAVRVAAELLQPASTTVVAGAAWWQRILPRSWGGDKAADDAEGLIRTVCRAELEALLAATEVSGRPLVVVFSAVWCGPCKLLSKQLAMVVSDMRAAGGRGADVEVVKVEAPDEDELATHLGVHKLPCTFFVGARGGAAPALRMEGLLSASVIEEAVRRKADVLGSDLRRAIKL